MLFVIKGKYSVHVMPTPRQTPRPTPRPTTRKPVGKFVALKCYSLQKSIPRV